MALVWAALNAGSVTYLPMAGHLVLPVNATCSQDQTQFFLPFHILAV